MTGPVELLAATGLSKRFGGIHALRDVSVVQHAGETLGMIGPNGSGKTSFVNAVTGHLRPDRGRIAFGGTDVTGAGPHRVTGAGLTRTYQAVRVFGRLSVADNLLTASLLRRADPPGGDARAELLAWLQLDTSMHKMAGSLSLFEQRRLELAMRLLLRPRLVMLDEPVGGLAAAEARAMIALLRQLRTRCGVFIIEHAMNVIRDLADRVVVLISGEKIADGTPEDILKDARVIQHYLGAPHA